MNLPVYQLGRAPWQESQLYYHALARLGREGLILCQPAEPYLCLGYHQDAGQELDLAWLGDNGLPYFRRETGGGVVYLDRDQVFWQLVLRRDSPLVSLDRASFFRRFLQPVISACRELGVAAELLPPNDVGVAGRRICGAGAGEIGDCVVFVGNLLRGFAPGLMARAAAAPDAGFRRCFRDAMGRWITSLRQELGAKAEAAVSDQRLYDLLAAGFAAQAGEAAPARIDEALNDEMHRQARRMLSPAWLGFRRKPRSGRRVKIRAGLFLCHVSLDAPGGELGCTCLLSQGKVREAFLYGTDGRADAASTRVLSHELAGLTEKELLPALEGLAWREFARGDHARRRGRRA